MLCFSNHSVCELSLVLGEMSLFLLSGISVTKSGSNPDVIRRQPYLWRTEIACLQHFWALTVWVHLLKKKMRFVYVYETESERTTSIQPWILSDITAGFTLLTRRPRIACLFANSYTNAWKSPVNQIRGSFIVAEKREKATKDLRCQGLEIQSLMMQKLKGNSEGKKLFLQDSQENMRAESRE